MPSEGALFCSCERKQPTIQEDGRLHYKLPVAPSAQIQATDRSSPVIRFPGVRKYHPDGRTVCPVAVDVKRFPYLLDLRRIGQVRRRSSEGREIGLGGLAEVLAQSSHKPPDDLPGSFGAACRLKAPCHR